MSDPDLNPKTKTYETVLLGDWTQIIQNHNGFLR